MRPEDAKRLFGILNIPSPLVLRHLRGPHSQAEMASYLKINQRQVTKWERGMMKRAPGSLRQLLEHYRAWTSSLGLPTWEILVAAHTRQKGHKQWPASASTTRAAPPDQASPKPSSTSSSPRRK